MSEQCYLGESSLNVTLKKIHDFHVFRIAVFSVVLLQQDSQLKFVLYLGKREKHVVLEYLRNFDNIQKCYIIVK